MTKSGRMRRASTAEQLTRWSFLEQLFHYALEAITTEEPAEVRKRKALECLRELAEIGPLTGVPSGVQADLAQILEWITDPKSVDFADLSYLLSKLHFVCLTHRVELEVKAQKPSRLIILEFNLKVEEAMKLDWPLYDRIERVDQVINETLAELRKANRPW